jgi:hypothetical protein
VALDLAEDHRDRVREQGVAARPIEAIDGLDQTDASALDEVVMRLSACAVAPREAPDEGHVSFDQALSRGAITSVVVGRQENLVGYL